MMSEEIKHCSRCGCVISNPFTADYFSHIRIMYCDKCREDVRREQTRKRVQELRKRKKQKDKFRDAELELMQERNKLLSEENELLRQRVQQLREQQTN